MTGVEFVPAFADGVGNVFVTLTEWVPNGTAVQSRPLTPVECRQLALELLEAADEAEGQP